MALVAALAALAVALVAALVAAALVAADSGYGSDRGGGGKVFVGKGVLSYLAGRDSLAGHMSCVARQGPLKVAGRAHTCFRTPRWPRRWPPLRLNKRGTRQPYNGLPSGPFRDEGMLMMGVTISS